jgi:chromosome segregation ATPase
MKHHILRTVLAAVLLFGVIAAVRANTQTAPSPDILPALLTEVRGLRAAMEQMASAGPRVQLALGRLQLQEQRLNTLIRRLESIRERLVSTQADVADHEERVKEMEKMMRQATEDRGVIAQATAEFSRQIARGTAEVQRLQAEEAVVAADVASEQNRWSDINQRLEELERALGRR